MLAPVENVSRETYERIERWYSDHQMALESYADRLRWWNKKINLISRELAAEDLELHLKHSLVIGLRLTALPLHTWVDAGSGGGLPGIPLAIVFPWVCFVLNDISPKKGVALRDMAYHLQLPNVQVQVGDIARLAHDGPFGVISKHAFKVEPLLHALDHKPWEALLMLKGADYLDDLAQISERPLQIKAFDLSSNEPATFYAGKYLLQVCPKT